MEGQTDGTTEWEEIGEETDNDTGEEAEHKEEDEETLADGARSKKEADWMTEEEETNQNIGEGEEYET